MEKRWLFKENPVTEIESLSHDLGVSPVVAGMLWRRELRDIDAARSFFNPTLEQLHDPFEMKDMELAVTIIGERLKRGRPIMVLGDYDVDGTTAASILHLYLQSLGIATTVYIPDREREGYGVSTAAIEKARELGIDLIITCDCGITALKATALARSHEIDMIITDHHIPGPELPQARAILNPKQADCAYPNKNLCGAGVAFKLVQGLCLSQDIAMDKAYELLDLAAIGTAADLVPVVGENRVIVHEGLTQIASSRRPGIHALKEVAGIRKERVQVSDIVFGLAPRINAVGRLGEASRAVHLLTAPDLSQATTYSRVLNSENENRKEIESGIVDEAIRLANAKYDPREKRGLVLYREGWHHGVIGIVASKLKERYWVPVVLIAVNDGLGKASARSLEGFDMYSALAQCADLLESFGGHTMAAGLTINPENLEAFEERFLELTASLVDDEMMQPRVHIEAEIEFADVNLQLMETLRRLAPYGPGNMRPVFATRGLQPTGHPRIVGGNHLKFKLKQGRRVLDAIGFGMAESFETLVGGHLVDCAYVLTENEWQGRKTIQLEVKDLRPAEQ